MGGWCVGERAAGVAREDFSHVLKGRGGKGANAGCSFFLGKINLSRGAWGEIVGDDSVDFAAKGLNSDWEGGKFFFLVSDVTGEKEEIRRNITHTAAISGPSEH